MNKILILLIGIFLIIPMTANATPPPAHGAYQGGWGMNPNNWQTTTGSFSAWGLYDPDGGGGGAGWIVDWSDPNNPGYIDYEEITLELWIEMYSLQTYHYTSYQWHRLGDEEEEICFIIEGLIQSNNGQYIQLMKGDDPLDYLYFRENVLGGSSSDARDIPISWSGRWGTGTEYEQNFYWPDDQGNWAPLTPDPDLTLEPVPACDHWFQFQGCFTLLYHEADGYYSLTMSGCPAPVM
ncbi:MAG: hypothetical protein GF315_04685 [candidate division Zixibacteria bacterium]|nr:hypothetical protein [candidate division Zixibacteria bacterium]